MKTVFLESVNSVSSVRPTFHVIFQYFDCLNFVFHIDPIEPVSVYALTTVGYLITYSKRGSLIANSRTCHLFGIGVAPLIV